MSIPCKLAYKAYKNFTSLGSSSNLVIAHGLLGSKQNWAGISKSLSRKLKMPVLPIDLRNHGDSPHSDVMNYEVMAEDIKCFITNENLKDVILMGHSMGGRAMMATVLLNPHLVKKLIVVDVSPVSATNTGEFANYLSAIANAKFNEENLSLAAVRKDVDKQLQAAISTREIRNFILANLIPSNEGYRWRVNVPVLLKSLQNIVEFPQFDVTYKQPTLFITGENSNYVKEEYRPEIQRLFPNSSIVQVSGAGHWVHADNPSEFMRIVIDFIQSTS